MNENELHLKRILADVFGIDKSAISETTSPQTLEEWDSVSHLKLILALEEQFNVTIPGEQIAEMLSYPRIKTVLSQAGITFNDLS